MTVYEGARHSVALVYVHGESVKSAFMGSVLSQVTAWESRELIGAVKNQPGAALVAEARNKAVGWFMAQAHLEWLWFVDADIEIMEHTLPELLAATKGEPCVACAAAWGRMKDGLALVWAVRSDGGIRRLRTLVPLPEGESVPLDACGAGCTLIHRNVLAVVGRMWGERPVDPDPWPWFGHDIDVDANGTPHRLGEDFSFCLRAGQAGFPILGVNTPVNHHKLMVLNGAEGAR